MKQEKRESRRQGHKKRPGNVNVVRKPPGQDADQDSSSSREAGPFSEVDEEEGERTRLNQSEIQEGPKGGAPEPERRSA